MFDYNKIFDDFTEIIRKVLYPEEWIALDLYLSKSELLTLLQVDRHGEIIMSRIADFIGIPMSTATGVVERLVKKGIIERTRSESDRRVVSVRLTDEGRKLAEKFKSTISGYIRLIYDNLTDDERNLLADIITKVAAILTDKKNQGETEENDVLRRINIE